MDIARVYSSDGILNPLNTEKYTFDFVNQMEDGEVSSHLTFFVAVLKLLMSDDHEFSDAAGAAVKKKKNDILKIKNPKQYFKSYGDMSLPVKPSSMRDLAYTMSIN